MCTHVPPQDAKKLGHQRDGVTLPGHSFLLPLETFMENSDLIDLTQDFDHEEEAPVIPRRVPARPRSPPEQVHGPVDRHDRARPTRDALAKHWCFTWNNPTLRSPQFASLIQEEWKATYAVFQLEQGENGTNHFQGYAEFSKKLRLASLKKLLPGAHWEKRRGTRPEAREYCMKDDETRLELPMEIGEWIPGDNSPNKFLAIRDMAREGASELQIADTYPEEYIRYLRGIRQLIVNQVHLLGIFKWP